MYKVKYANHTGSIATDKIQVESYWDASNAKPNFEHQETGILQVKGVLYFDLSQSWHSYSVAMPEQGEIN